MSSYFFGGFSENYPHRLHEQVMVRPMGHAANGGSPIARASAWYEMMPRSQSAVFGKHGTFDDCINRLPDIAAMGFDVLYLTPIH
jgi:glycosidase